MSNHAEGMKALVFLLAVCYVCASSVSRLPLAVTSPPAREEHFVATCHDPGPINNSWRDPPPATQYYTPGRVIIYNCFDGYVLDGFRQMVCTTGGYWEPSKKPECIQKEKMHSTCPVPAHLANGWIKPMKPQYPAGDVISYHCDAGYTLEQHQLSLCTDQGKWLPEGTPHCVIKRPAATCPVPKIKNGKVKALPHGYKPGEHAVIQCNSGYKVSSTVDKRILCKSDGNWIDSRGSRTPPACRKTKCPAPPQIANGEWINYHADFREGYTVSYECFRGYMILPNSQASSGSLTCKTGHWNGVVPACVRILNCDSPPSLPNGHYISLGSHNTYSYGVGSRVEYRCNKDYKLLGESVIQCMDVMTWSHMPPKCIPNTADNVYCSTPRVPEHGSCTCHGQDMNFCQPFTPGDMLECGCALGYHIQGFDVLLCQGDGTWNEASPTCAPEGSNKNSSPSEGSISALAIVIATACSVLGMLLLVMVGVMMFRRHKPRPLTYSPSHTSSPPPYSRVHSDSLDEHDRLALIACNEGRECPNLPSYEEATGEAHARLAVFSQSTRSRDGRNIDYRPLPPVPHSLRSGVGVNPLPNPIISSSTTINSTHSFERPFDRHSLVTNSTINRDGVSEVFGSIDTVNVSVSDASTSITVETFDSGGGESSNPSTSSRHANAGSIGSGSSNGSLATEDVPLLDPSHTSESTPDHLEHTSTDKDETC